MSEGNGPTAEGEVPPQSKTFGRTLSNTVHNPSELASQIFEARLREGFIHKASLPKGGIEVEGHVDPIQEDDEDDDDEEEEDAEYENTVAANTAQNAAPSTAKTD